MHTREDMRTTLATAARTAGCSDVDFCLVGPHQYRNILEQIIARFCSRGPELAEAPWLWEHFVGPRESLTTDHALETLATLLAPAERIWFIAEDWPGTKQHGNYWLYDTTVSVALRVLREAHAFEYYLVKRDLSWLICENHHDLLIGVGEPIVSVMRTAES